MHQPPIPQIDSSDPEIAGLIHSEARRQAEKSENCGAGLHSCRQVTVRCEIDLARRAESPIGR